jgi:hypothetical protein
VLFTEVGDDSTFVNSQFRKKAPAIPLDLTRLSRGAG